MSDGLLKIPVVLTKITSKKGQDHELMWQVTVETHAVNAEAVQTLIPLVDQYFTMVLVKTNEPKKKQEADDDGIVLEDTKCQKAKKKATKAKTKKRAR